MAASAVPLVCREFYNVAVDFQWRHVDITARTDIDTLLMVLLPRHRHRIQRLTCSFEDATVEVDEEDEHCYTSTATMPFFARRGPQSITFAALEQLEPEAHDMQETLYRTLVFVLDSSPNIAHLRVTGLAEDWPSGPGDHFAIPPRPPNWNAGAILSRATCKIATLSCKDVPWRIVQHIVRWTPALKEAEFDNCSNEDAEEWEDWWWAEPLPQLEKLVTRHQTPVLDVESCGVNALRVLHISDPVWFGCVSLRSIFWHARRSLEEVDIYPITPDHYEVVKNEYIDLFKRPDDLADDEFLLPRLHTLRAPRHVICPGLAKDAGDPISDVLRLLVLTSAGWATAPDRTVYKYSDIVTTLAGSLKKVVVDCKDDMPDSWKEVEQDMVPFAACREVCRRERIEFKWRLSNQWAQEGPPDLRPYSPWNKDDGNEPGECPARLRHLIELV